MDHIPENEPPEVAFLESALQGAITQGASHIHIEPVDDDVAVRFRVGREYREFASEPRDILAVMTRLRTLAGLSVVPPLGPEWGVIEFQNGERRIASPPRCYQASQVKKPSFRCSARPIWTPGVSTSWACWTISWPP